jgi:hypothetical protein
MKASISVRLLASSQINPGPKPYEIWDRDLRGFVLRIQSTGAMSCVVQVGRGRRVTIGTVDPMTPTQAREGG